MTLSERAIEYPRLVILAAILICVIGGSAIMTLPKERTPRVKLPLIVVAVPNPGADPATNEREIVRRIEDETGSLTGLKDSGAVYSQAVHGAAIVNFVFDSNEDVDDAKDQVHKLIDRIKGQFPPEAQKDPGPIITDVAFDSFPVIQIFVAGGADGKQRRRIAERLQNQVEQIPGVAAVDLFGGLEEEVQIEIDPNRLTLYGFSYEQVADALRRANVSMPSGAIEQASGSETRVRSDAKLKDIEAIRGVALGVRNGTPVQLADVANVYLGHKATKSIARYDGEDAVVLLARAKTDIDVLATANAVQHQVDRFVASGGNEDTHIGTVRSQAREIHYMLAQLGSSALYGTALVFVMLWIAMGWRMSLLIGIAIPFSILGTAAIMWFTKRSITPDLAINNMTLFAMILVVGMVVDGCIIVGENIFRHREMGRAPVDAAKRGVREVGSSLLAAYLTTFAAFAPMFLVRGIMGDFLELLPIVVLFALCSAILVDHFLLPVLSVYLMRASTRKQQVSPEHQNISPDELELRNVDALVNASRVARTYGRMLQYALHHRVLVMVLAVIISLTPVALFMGGAVALEFFPESDVPIVEVYYELPLGAGMQTRTLEIGRQIEQAVLKAVRPEEWFHPIPGGPPVKPVTTIGEPGALNIRVDAPQDVGPEYGMVYVELELAQNRDRSAAEIRRAIAESMPPMPGVIVQVKSPSDGPPVGAPVIIRIRGQKQTSLETLADRARVIEREMRGIPGTYDVTNDYRLRPGLRVEPDEIMARMYGLDVAQIASGVNFALDGVKVGEVDFGGDEFIDLRIRNALDDRDNYDDLANLPLRSPTGRVVTLDQVSQLQRTDEPNIIRHYDRDRVINIRAWLEDGVYMDEVKARLVAALRPELSAAQQRQLVQSDDLLVSDGELTIEFGGETEIRDEALEDLNVALIVSFAAMLIILTVQFNSFIQPAIVLFSVPLSIVGVALGLILCGFPFSIAAMIGVVALSGIVVNDAIVLVDFINQMRKHGIAMDRAVIYAGQLRLRPIFLTTITTIGGLLPLGLNLSGGGEFWQPLTVTIMFGLAFATLLQLFIVPLACYTFNRHNKPGLLDPTLRPEYAGVAAPPAVTQA